MEIGLLNYVVSDNETLDQKIDDLVRLILISSKNAVHQGKRLLRQLSLKNHALQEFLTETIADLRVSPEGQEGISAFLDKRKPNWHPEN